MVNNRSTLKIPSDLLGEVSEMRLHPPFWKSLIQKKNNRNSKDVVARISVLTMSVKCHHLKILKERNKSISSGSLQFSVTCQLVGSWFVSLPLQ